MRTLILPLVVAACFVLPGQADAKPLSDAAIDRVVSKHSVRVRDCYIKHAGVHTGGKVMLALHIQRMGRVKRVKVHVKDGSTRLKRCITRSARRWRFPRADTKTFLHYPFVFKYAAAHR